jgi:hypothetical protein
MPPAINNQQRARQQGEPAVSWVQRLIGMKASDAVINAAVAIMHLENPLPAPVPVPAQAPAQALATGEAPLLKLLPI